MQVTEEHKLNTEITTEQATQAATAPVAVSAETPKHNAPATDSTIEEIAANAGIAARKPVDPHDKKAARLAFHAVNLVGLHMIFNSTVSLLIAYNLLPTKFAQRQIKALATSPFGHAADKLFSLPAKGIDAVLKLGGVKLNPKVLTETEKMLEMRHSARSSVETAFMCIAGFFALAPVKYMEDHRAQFLNTVDNWLHPNRSEAEKKAAELKPDDEPKETWGNLLRARFIALAAVFSVDRIQQHINNWMTYERGNIDTVAWKFGAKTFDNMNHKLREGIINFFDRKHVGAAGVQEMIRAPLLHAIDAPQELHDATAKLKQMRDELKANYHDVTFRENQKAKIRIFAEKIEKNPAFKEDIQKVVFAEQSRLVLTKELWLTFVMSVVIYTAAKAPFMAKFFEKIGMGKKETAKAEPQTAPTLESVTSTVEVQEKEPDGELTTQKQTIKITPREKPQKPQPRYTQKLSSEEKAAFSPVL